MSMEVSNNYSNYVASNNALVGNKADNLEKDNSSKTYRSTSEYKNYLAEKYDCLKSKEYSVEINGSLAAKAATDEKTSQWLEYNLSLIPGAVEKMRASAEARGTKVISCNVKINGYDDMTTELVTQDVVDTGTEKAKKELEERIKKTRAEKKEAKKKAAEKSEEERNKKKQIEKLQSDERNFTAIGGDVSSVTQTIVSALSKNAEGGTIVGFDAKV